VQPVSSTGGESRLVAVAPVSQTAAASRVASEASPQLGDAMERRQASGKVVVLTRSELIRAVAGNNVLEARLKDARYRVALRRAFAAKLGDGEAGTRGMVEVLEAHARGDFAPALRAEMSPGEVLWNVLELKRILHKHNFLVLTGY